MHPISGQRDLGNAQRPSAHSSKEGQQGAGHALAPRLRTNTYTYIYMYIYCIIQLNII